MLNPDAELWRLVEVRICTEHAWTATWGGCKTLSVGFAWRRNCNRSWWILKTYSVVGHSPLHEAADRGHHAVLTFLLKCIDSSQAVNCLTTDGSTPLHLAAKMGHDQCVMVLLAAGADPKVRDGSGKKPKKVAKQQTTRSLIAARLQAEGSRWSRQLIAKLRCSFHWQVANAWKNRWQWCCGTPED